MNLIEATSPVVARPDPYPISTRDTLLCKIHPRSVTRVWNVNTEKHIERAVAIGERNNSTLELVRNWCAYIEIKKDGAGGIVEQQTGLPIDPRYLTCPHAAAPGFIGSDLTFLALDFHDRNCVGCPNRKPVGLPNLSILVQEREAARATESANTARREAEAAAARGARDAVRQALRCGLAPPFADVVDQIEELDHGADGANADRLVETARLAPEVFTPPLVEYAFTLLESGESWFDNAGLRLLKTLGADRIRLTRCALLCIPRYFAMETAADILLENVELADETLIAGAIPGLISIANPRRMPLMSREGVPITAPLIRLHEAFPASVETVIRRLIENPDPYSVSDAARGIAVLAGNDKLLPGHFARTLISKLVRDRRLLQASEFSDGDGETVNEVRQALALAFEVAPAKIDDLLKAFLLGASEIGEVRVFSIYRAVLRRSRFDHSEITEATRIALKRVVWHAARTDRLDVLREIESILSGGPFDLASLAAEEVENLIGVAILIQAKLESLNTEPAIHNPTVVAGLERYRRQMTLQTLRRAFIKWAAAGAGTTPAAARTYCEILGNLPSEGQDKVKAEMVRNLDQVMETTSGLNAALPHLYTAMVGGSVALRACAADAIGGLNHRQLDNFPGLVFEAFLALLNDPYIAAHQQAVHALRRLWSLPDDHRPAAKRALLDWAVTYSSDRAHDRFFIECLDFYIDPYAEPDEFSGQLGARLLTALQGVEPYLVAGEINTFGHVLQRHGDFIELLARLIGDPTAWDIHHEKLTRALADLPVDAVRPKVQALETLAQAQEVQAHNIEALFVELFTRGAWEAAERLAGGKVAGIPDDTWNRTRKLAVRQIHFATEFEAALASGSVDQVSRLSAEWKTLEEAVKKDRTENEERHDPLRGLPRQN